MKCGITDESHLLSLAGDLWEKERTWTLAKKDPF